MEEDRLLGDAEVVDIGTHPAARFAAAIRRRYENTLFLHFRMPVEIVRAWIPARLTLDLFEGSAWVGIVFGSVRSTRPALPGTAHELTVRTYVSGGGIYLLDLELDHALSLWTAQRILHLRSRRSRMVQLREGRALAFSAHRSDEGRETADLTATWTPGKLAEVPMPGSFEAFITTRAKLSSLEQDLAMRWTTAALAPARIGMFHSTILEQLGFPAPRSEPLVHHAAQQLLELPFAREKK